ncbi:MAG TPA: hypothetical protein VMU64_08850 [Acidimicrobiales bacterium]|nr:hypothetical protein [Acidimicrobiales bacterium]
MLVLIVLVFIVLVFIVVARVVVMMTQRNSPDRPQRVGKGAG